MYDPRMYEPVLAAIAARFIKWKEKRSKKNMTNEDLIDCFDKPKQSPGTVRMEYKIDGHTYRLVQDNKSEKKREPIKAWANVYPDGSFRDYAYKSREYAEKMKYTGALECVELHEVPKGAMVLNPDQIHEAWTIIGLSPTSLHSKFPDFLKALGFDGKEGV